MTPSTSPPSPRLLEATRRDVHPRCVVCSRPVPNGLGLKFQVLPDGSVTASFGCGKGFEGYGGMLHGGVISAIADGAMTNCLFAHGIAAVTAEMTVRFRHPIALDAVAVVRAHINRSQAPMHIVEAQIVQAGQVKAKATGKFMERPLS